MREGSFHKSPKFRSIRIPRHQGSKERKDNPKAKTATRKTRKKKRAKNHKRKTRNNTAQQQNTERTKQQKATSQSPAAQSAANRNVDVQADAPEAHQVGKVSLRRPEMTEEDSLGSKPRANPYPRQTILKVRRNGDSIRKAVSKNCGLRDLPRY